MDFQVIGSEDLIWRVVLGGGEGPCEMFERFWDLSVFFFYTTCLPYASVHQV